VSNLGRLQFEIFHWFASLYEKSNNKKTNKKNNNTTMPKENKKQTQEMEFSNRNKWCMALLCKY
jgi:hypothetical protein